MVRPLPQGRGRIQNTRAETRKANPVEKAKVENPPVRVEENPLRKISWGNVPNKLSVKGGLSQRSPVNPSKGKPGTGKGNTKGKGYSNGPPKGKSKGESSKTTKMKNPTPNNNGWKGKGGKGRPALKG